MFLSSDAPNSKKWYEGLIIASGVVLTVAVGALIWATTDSNLGFIILVPAVTLWALTRLRLYALAESNSRDRGLIDRVAQVIPGWLLLEFLGGLAILAFLLIILYFTR